MMKRFYMTLMLAASLVLAGCSSTSDSGGTYTVKRGDTCTASPAPPAPAFAIWPA